jgi:hypothetical protein
MLAVVLFEQARSLRRRFQELDEMKEAAVQRAGDPAFS